MAQTNTLPAEVDKQALTLRDHIARAQPEFAKTLPDYIKPERFTRTAQSALLFTRNIEKVKNAQSLLSACMKAAADGLILDGREAALVVDYHSEVQYRPMMRGLLKLAYNSGIVSFISVQVVRKGDVFEHVPTSPNPVMHKISYDGERGEAIVVYALATLKDGAIVHEVMTISQINGIRDRSDAWKAYKAGKIKSTPWHTDWEEMARKTVFRRLSKYLPSSADRDAFHQAVERIDADYSFDHDVVEHGSDLPAQQPAQSKKRGAAAAKLKDVTPSKATPKDAAGRDVPHDQQSGEVIDNDGPDQNDPRFANDDQGPEDDI